MFTALTTTQKLPCQRIRPSLSAFTSVITDSTPSSYFHRVDTYSLEHSGSLGCETCHFLGFCFLKDWISCPKWIISHCCLEHWYVPAATVLCEDVTPYVPAPVLSLCFLGWPSFLWDAQMPCCHLSYSHTCIRTLGFIASGHPLINFLLPVAIKFHV